MNEPKPCGTRAAYYRHRRHGEVPCEACVRGNTAAKRKPAKPTPSRRKPIKHGTPAGYKQHLYRGEIACDDCLTAERDRNRAYQATRRQAARRAGGAR